ncbi:MAG: pyridoxal-phosphate dependent enzyme [Candidatus Competibacteraceae bacterium]|nr:pyridoxal-phosphate dependent enzyme [Candidatus Competibacteraceae bacterium]
MWNKNILEAIGNTPMVQLNRITRDIEATVLAKVETFNPGNSIKDRMALKMVEDAEKSGLLKPGGTIIEGTSGNTGMGLAIAAILKGYKCIFTTTDKQSREKVDALRAFGAEVIVCPTNVDPEDPRSYYSVSSRLVNEVPNSWKPNQYDNLSNRQAHYESTGPEIWEQTEGAVTHLVAGVGTGGTITGTGMYLKEQNSNIKVIGIDTYGSVFKKYKETGIFDKNEIYPYVTEGIGEDFLPQNVDFSIVDYFEKVTDKDAAVMTRRIVKEEGIWVGNSSGAAMQGLMQIAHQFKKDDVVVVIFVDHGTRYLGKMFNDDWMLKMGYLDKSGLAVCDLINASSKNELSSIEAGETINAAARLMTSNDYSQVPVTEQGRIVGTLHEKKIFSHLLASPDKLDIPVREIMDEALPFVDINTSCGVLSDMLSDTLPAVLVRDFKTDKNYIITRSDLIRLMI